MQASESSMPSSMLTSMMLAPPRTWSIATVAAPGQSFAFTSRSNFFDPVTLVRSPIIWKFESGRMTSGSSPDSRVRRVPLRAWCLVPRAARARCVNGLGDLADVIGCGAAAAADDVDEAALGELLHQRRGFFRLLVVLAERIRQARRSGSS